jgi:signal transduction histidine kinase
VRHFATVRVRVTVAAVVVVGLSMVLGSTWLLRAHRTSLTQGIETNARLRSRDIASTVADGAFPRTLAVPRGDDNLVQVVDAAGDIVASSVNDKAERRISTLQPGGDGYAAESVGNLVGEGPFRVVARRVRTTAGPLTVYVAGSLGSVDESEDSLERLLLFGVPILVLLVGATTWVVTGRALHPVEDIRREVEAIGAEDLHRRVPEPKTADEIGRLARTMNAMLGRLEDATDRQARFVADASHELRSPLTGIRAQLEVDLAHPEHAKWQTTERAVLMDTVRLQRLIEDLLAIATAHGASNDASHRETVDLDEIVLSETRRLRGRSEHDIDTAAVSGAQLQGNPDQLTRAVRNLLDNAERHADRAVSVSLVETEDAVRLSVIDDGPGIPEDQHARIFERFTRLDDARARDNGGSGLGLAITREVVLAHGGSITIDNAPGARFTVVFPLPRGGSSPVPAGA